MTKIVQNGITKIDGVTITTLKDDIKSIAGQQANIELRIRQKEVLLNQVKKELESLNDESKKASAMIQYIENKIKQEETLNKYESEQDKKENVTPIEAVKKTENKEEQKKEQKEKK